MTLDEIKRVVEALLFIAEKPITIGEIKEVLGEGSFEEIKGVVSGLGEEYRREGRSFQLIEIAGGFQLMTLPEFSPWLKKFHGADRAEKLSRPALETLAIIAYRQPIIRTEVETVRGVNVEGVLKTLLEKRLIRVMGRRNVVGRPLIYGTTNEFLQLFGLKALSELPRIEDFKEEIPVLRKEVPVSGTEETSSGDR